MALLGKSNKVGQVHMCEALFNYENNNKTTINFDTPGLSSLPF